MYLNKLLFLLPLHFCTIKYNPYLQRLMFNIENVFAFFDIFIYLTRFTKLTQRKAIILKRCTQLNRNGKDTGGLLPIHLYLYWIIQLLLHCLALLKVHLFFSKAEKIPTHSRLSLLKDCTLCFALLLHNIRSRTCHDVQSE